eukprot:TRINITY_DN9406_c0_g5_i4.p1 TRINITY_DN9406_c0_g5~~TRINITY_DN9406_c0_g5_i4.p1  ORF type:complete len:209 (-),score=30.51 TRINITY_DN9406_c0_g5_i4:269-895(-)
MLYSKVKKGLYSIPQDKPLSSECVSLISGLLKVNPQERLSAAEVLSHPWFDKRGLPGPTIYPDPCVLANYLYMDKLQKLVIAFIASHTPDSNLMMFMRTFVNINKSKTGVLSKEELKAWISENGVEESSINDAFALMDINQSKAIEYLGNYCECQIDFVTAFLPEGMAINETTLTNAFTFFDKVFSESKYRMEMGCYACTMCCKQWIK